MSTGKMCLAEASALAAEIVSAAAPHASRLEVAGSIRRKKPVVGDVELVAVITDQDEFCRDVSQFGISIKPGVPDAQPWIPKPGAKYLRFRLHAGVNLDVFVADPTNWGGIFLMRTGSGVGPDGNPFNGFVPAMFSRFKKLSGGGRMTGGLPTLPTGERIPLPEEDDFFKLLQMTPVPPEERISRSVIKKFVIQP